MAKDQRIWSSASRSALTLSLPCHTAVSLCLQVFLFPGYELSDSQDVASFALVSLAPGFNIGHSMDLISVCEVRKIED